MLMACSWRGQGGEEKIGDETKGSLRSTNGEKAHNREASWSDNAVERLKMAVHSSSAVIDFGHVSSLV